MSPALLCGPTVFFHWAILTPLIHHEKEDPSIIKIKFCSCVATSRGGKLFQWICKNTDFILQGNLQRLKKVLNRYSISIVKTKECVDVGWQVYFQLLRYDWRIDTHMNLLPSTKKLELGVNSRYPWWKIRLGGLQRNLLTFQSYCN